MAARTDRETPQVDSGSESEPDLESTGTVCNSLNFNSVLNSSDESDSDSSDHNKLDDFGLLFELLNDEFMDRDKRKFGRLCTTSLICITQAIKAGTVKHCVVVK